MTVDASPGMFSKMELIRPPYSQPKYTAANKISADSGGKPKANAIGISSATPLIGPRPGNKPTTVPIKVPHSAVTKL